MLPRLVMLNPDLLKLLVIVVNYRWINVIAMASPIIFNLIPQSPEPVKARCIREPQATEPEP